MMTCYECGEKGHLARDCPNVSWISGTGGGWCGYCDERTCLVDLGHTVRRCTTCHPNRGKQLAQHRKCSGCNNRVYSWDNSPCGHHQKIGPRPHVIVVSTIPAPRDLRSLALAQAAEARAARIVLDVQQEDSQAAGQDDSQGSQKTE